MAASPKLSSVSRRVLNLLGPFIGLLLVVGLFSLSSEVRPYFLTGANAKIILTQTVIVAIGTLGMTIIIVSGGIDLSVGSSVTAAALTIAVGGAFGLLNGLALGGLRMMPFIVTLGMMGVGRGTAKWLSGSQTVNPPDNPLNRIMLPRNPNFLWPVPNGVWIALGLAVVMAIVMRRTVFGR